MSNKKKDSNTLSNLDLKKIILMGCLIYFIIMLWNFVSTKINIFIGGLVPVFALLLYFIYIDYKKSK